MGETNVLVVDDHDLIRMGLSSLIEEVEGATVVAQCCSGEEALRAVRDYQPEIVFMDLKMPGIGGLEATRRLLMAHPELKVVIITAVEGDLFPRHLLKAGAAGYVTKKADREEIETALRIGTPIVILIFNDGGYGLIEWHQLRRFGRTSHVDFGNPDFVKFAESFGAKGYRVQAADELGPLLAQALADDTVVVIDCPVDYSENMKLTERLGNLVCPI